MQKATDIEGTLEESEHGAFTLKTYQTFSSVFTTSEEFKNTKLRLQIPPV